MAKNTKGTLKYRKIQRTPQTGENAGKKKWYATAVTDREMSFEDFVTHIADHTSPFSRGTVHGVLTDTLDCLQELILDGKSVRLGELGLFSIGMTSKPEDTKADVSAQSILGVHLIVRNTKTWSNAELAKRCKLKEYGSYDTASDSSDSSSDSSDSTDSSDSSDSGSKPSGGTTPSGGSSSEGTGGGSSTDEDGGGASV